MVCSRAAEDESDEAKGGEADTERAGCQAEADALPVAIQQVCHQVQTSFKEFQVRRPRAPRVSNTIGAQPTLATSAYPDHLIQLSESGRSLIVRCASVPRFDPSAAPEET
jgi:hypothetical protein